VAVRIATGADGGTIVVKTAAPQAAGYLHVERSLLAVLNVPGVVELAAAPAPQNEVWTVLAGRRTVASTHITDFPTIAGLLCSIATIVGDLHDLGISHGRLTADHIILSDRGLPVLCSLGRAGLAPAVEPLADRRAGPFAPQDDLRSLAVLLADLVWAVPVPDSRRQLRTAERRRAQLLTLAVAVGEPTGLRSARELADVLRAHAVEVRGQLALAPATPGPPEPTSPSAVPPLPPPPPPPLLLPEPGSPATLATSPRHAHPAPSTECAEHLVAEGDLPLDLATPAGGDGAPATGTEPATTKGNDAPAAADPTPNNSASATAAASAESAVTRPTPAANPPEGLSAAGDPVPSDEPHERAADHASTDPAPEDTQATPAEAGPAPSEDVDEPATDEVQGGAVDQATGAAPAAAGLPPTATTNSAPEAEPAPLPAVAGGGVGDWPAPAPPPVLVPAPPAEAAVRPFGPRRLIATPPEGRSPATLRNDLAASRRRLAIRLAAAAVLAVVAGAGTAVAVNALRATPEAAADISPAATRADTAPLPAAGPVTTSGPTTTATPPTTVAAPVTTSRACPPSYAEAAASGIPSHCPVRQDGRDLIVGALRWRVGAPGDLVAAGDAGCDGTLDVAVATPSTGDVHLFTSWSVPGADTSGVLIATEPSLTALRWEPDCTLVVESPTATRRLTAQQLGGSE
jgi:hypothetical protein